MEHDEDMMEMDRSLIRAYRTLSCCRSCQRQWMYLESRAHLSSTSREICVVLLSTAMMQGGTGAFATPCGPSAMAWAVRALGRMYSS